MCVCARVRVCVRDTVCGDCIVFDGYFADVCNGLTREMWRVVPLLRGVWKEPTQAARFPPLLEFTHKLFMMLDSAAVGEFDLLSALRHFSIPLQLDRVGRSFCVDLMKHGFQGGALRRCSARPGADVL